MSSRWPSGSPRSAFTATAPATAEAALPPCPPESGRPFPDREADALAARGNLARAPQHPARREPGGVPLRLPRELGMTGIEDPEAGLAQPLRPHNVAIARHREAEDVEAGADVPDAPRSERRDRPAHAPARRRMSFSTPAAVTSAPAPGPRITRGFAL